MQFIFGIGSMVLLGIVVDDKGGWLRVLGRGIYWRPANIPPLFSERYGFRHTVQIGQWRVGCLDWWTL